MSLKAFHLLFITISVLLAAGFGIWCLWTRGGEPGYLVTGIASFVAGAGLIAYEAWFLKKVRSA